MTFRISQLKLSSSEKHSLSQFLKKHIEPTDGRYNKSDSIYTLYNHAKTTINISDKRRLALNRFIASIAILDSDIADIPKEYRNLTTKEKIDAIFEGMK